MSRTILVVEDTDDTRKLLRLVLEFEGYDVIEADSGFEAVELAIRHHPDAIVMDMSLPVIDGCQVTRLIRKELADVPIIACTAYNRWEWRGKAILAGCTDFLSKPLKVDELVSTLTRCLNPAAE